MAAVYSNENVPMQVVIALREMGHTVVTSREAGNANQRISDEAVLKFASQGSSIALTGYRADFRKLHG